MHISVPARTIDHLVRAYIENDRVCATIMQRDFITEADCDLHTSALNAAGEAFRQILHQPLTTPADAAKVAELVAYIYRETAEDGDFPAPEVADLLMRLVGVLKQTAAV